MFALEARVGGVLPGLQAQLGSLSCTGRHSEGTESV